MKLHGESLKKWHVTNGLCQFLTSCIYCWMVYIHHIYFQHSCISAHLFSCYFCLLQIKLLWSWLCKSSSDNFPLFSYGRVISAMVSLHVSNHSMFFIELKFYFYLSLILQLQLLCGTMGPKIVLAFFIILLLYWLLTLLSFLCGNLIPNVIVVGGGSWRMVISLWGWTLMTGSVGRTHF